MSPQRFRFPVNCSLRIQIQGLDFLRLEDFPLFIAWFQFMIYKTKFSGSREGVSEVSIIDVISFTLMGHCCAFCIVSDDKTLQHSILDWVIWELNTDVKYQLKSRPFAWVIHHWLIQKSPRLNTALQLEWRKWEDGFCSHLELINEQ